MHKKLLAIFAHPDDEAFGPGGTLAKYADLGVEIHLLCATRGEKGEWDEKSKIKEKIEIQHIREKELLRSAEIIGIKQVEFLDYIDGYLCNAIYHELAEKIINKINSFKPQVVLTFDRLGISGHLDHVTVSLVTTYSFLKTNFLQKLYYLCLPNKWYDKSMADYFIYFPQGYKEEEITTRIDFSKYWEIKKKAMLCHKSQLKDVKNLLYRFSKWPKVDHFILQYYRSVKVKLPEKDLFAGIL